MRKRRHKCMREFSDNARNLNVRTTLNMQGKWVNSGLLKYLVRNWDFENVRCILLVQNSIQ